MKLNFSLKKQEANLEADVEGVIEKQLEYKSKQPARKTKYQIKQEEKRKNEELKHKQKMQHIFIGIGCFAAVIVFCVIMSFLST